MTQGAALENVTASEMDLTPDLAGPGCGLDDVTNPELDLEAAVLATGLKGSKTDLAADLSGPCWA